MERREEQEGESNQCSDDEVIFVEERRVVTTAVAVVKSEPELAEDNVATAVNGKAIQGNTDNEMRQGGEANDVGTEQMVVDTAVPGSSAGKQAMVVVPERDTDEISAAVEVAIQAAEREVRASSGGGGDPRIVESDDRMPSFTNVFTAQFIGPPKFFETTKLSGKHIWDTNELSNIPFHHWVTNNRNSRTDMQFFHELHEYHPTVAKNAWAQLRENIRYVIPETLNCSRSFVREMLEVYYLDRTDAFLEEVVLEEISVQNIPLLEERITDRQWNVFSKRPGHFQELYNRRTHGVWLPHDQPEIGTYSVEDLRTDYPEVEQWFQDLDQPSGLPIPCPPVIYYYHHELAADSGGNGGSTRIRKLRTILRLEFACLFLCTWFMECALGGRHFLLESSTVDMIAKCVEGRQGIIRDVSTSYILELMRQGKLYDSQLYNTFRYVKTKDEYYNMYRQHEPPLPDSIFLYCYKGSGIIKTRESGGQVAYQTLWCRRMNMALKQSRKSEREWISPLDAILTSEDLRRLPELEALIRARNWDQNSELCVYDLLRNLLDLNSRSVQTNIRISSGSTSLRKERDSLVRIINNAIDGPPHDKDNAEQEYHMNSGQWGRLSEQSNGRAGYVGGSPNGRNDLDYGYGAYYRNSGCLGNFAQRQEVYDTTRAVQDDGRNRNSWRYTRDGGDNRYDVDRDGEGAYYRHSMLKRPRIVGRDEYANVGLERHRISSEVLGDAETRGDQQPAVRNGVQLSGNVSAGNTIALGNRSEMPSTAVRNEDRSSSGKEVGSGSDGNDAPTGTIMPAFQPRRPSRKRTFSGERSCPDTHIGDSGISRPRTPGTPIPEVDITGEDGNIGTSGVGTSAVPPAFPRHPWGFCLK